VGFRDVYKPAVKLVLLILGAKLHDTSRLWRKPCRGDAHGACGAELQRQQAFAHVTVAALKCSGPARDKIRQPPFTIGHLLVYPVRRKDGWQDLRLGGSGRNERTHGPFKLWSVVFRPVYLGILEFAVGISLRNRNRAVPTSGDVG
jgi:hypothetical protein